MTLDVVAPLVGAPDAHVVDYEVQRFLSLGWQAYVRIVRDAAGGELPAAVVREITTNFDDECHGGDVMMMGIRATQRSRRSYVLHVELWNATTGRTVARSRVVMTGIDRSTGRAGEPPARFWEAMDTLEGHPVPVATRHER